MLASDAYGKTGLHLGAENGRFEIVKRLTEKFRSNLKEQTPQNQINLNAKDSFSKTALHLAADNGHSLIVRNLIEAGASLTLTTRY